VDILKCIQLHDIADFVCRLSNLCRSVVQLVVGLLLTIDYLVNLLYSMFLQEIEQSGVWELCAM